MSTNSTLNRFIRDMWLDDPAEPLSDDESLLALNIIDSVAILEITHFMQYQFDVVVPARSIVPANFESVNAMANLVDRLKSGMA